MKCYCGREARLVSSRVVYGKHHGRLWICTAFPEMCDGVVGCHGKSDVPLGTLASAEVRGLRQRCHIMFDRLWKGDTRIMTRRKAYDWLDMLFGRRDVHIGDLQKRSCETILSVMLDLRMAGVDV